MSTDKSAIVQDVGVGNEKCLSDFFNNSLLHDFILVNKSTHATSQYVNLYLVTIFKL
jgi:hypothetical protein